MRYAVHVSRGDSHWLIHVPDVDRSTQSRSIRDVDPMARDLIAVMSDHVDPDTVELDIVIQVPEAAAALWQHSAELHEQAAQLKARGAVEAGAAARALRELGLTIRDIGAVLQVSYQRADQLLRQGVVAPGEAS